MDAVVLGINQDSAESHQQFATKLGLDFPLLIDEKGEVARAYGVLPEGAPRNQRTVVIVNKSGVIRYYQRGMPPDSELIEAIHKFPAAGG